MRRNSYAPPLTDEQGSETASRPLVPAVLFAVTAALLSFAAYTHVLWRDEALAWLVSRNSPSLPALFYPMHYQGHPPLWYLLLYVLTRFSWDPVWMKLLNLVVALAVSALLLFTHRLPLWIRAGVALSYFFVFEYGTIERNYLLGIGALLLAVQYLTSNDARRRFHAIWWLCIAALASDPTLALAFPTFLVWLVRDQAADSSPFHLRQTLRQPKTWLAAALLGLCVALSVATVRPPADSGLRDDPSFALNKFHRLAATGRDVARAFLPIPVPATQTAWNVTLWDDSRLEKARGDIAAGWLVLALAILYFRRPLARWYFLACTAVLFCLLVSSARAAMRHVGPLFIAFVLALFLEHAADRRRLPTAKPGTRWRDAALAAVLLVQVSAGLFAIACSARRPFSSAARVADYMRAQGLQNAPLLIYPAWMGSSVLACLQAPAAYSVEFHAPVSYIIWNHQERQYHWPTRQDMEQAAAGRGRPVLITVEPLPADRQADLGVHLLTSFDRSASLTDQYFLYR